MNYKELWAQARALAFEEPVDMDGPLEGFKGFNQQVYEKFGELIVRECAQVCNNIDAEYEGEDVLATWCANAIKKHFGIEL